MGVQRASARERDAFILCVFVCVNQNQNQNIFYCIENLWVHAGVWVQHTLTSVSFCHGAILNG